MLEQVAVADRCGPGDVIWVVKYLTELLEMNFEALVAKDSASKEHAVAFVVVWSGFHVYIVWGTRH